MVVSVRPTLGGMNARYLPSRTGAAARPAGVDSADQRAGEG
jgi:hypothetical protein